MLYIMKEIQYQEVMQVKEYHQTQYQKEIHGYYGNENDIASGEDESQMAKNTVVLKVEGNLTIGEGTVLTSVSSNAGFRGAKRNDSVCQRSIYK